MQNCSSNGDLSLGQNLWDINICVVDVRQPVITEYVMNGINENKIIYI